MELQHLLAQNLVHSLLVDNLLVHNLVHNLLAQNLVHNLLVHNLVHSLVYSLLVHNLLAQNLVYSLLAHGHSSLRRRCAIGRHRGGRCSSIFCQRCCLLSGPSHCWGGMAAAAAAAWLGGVPEALPVL